MTTKKTVLFALALLAAGSAAFAGETAGEGNKPAAASTSTVKRAEAGAAVKTAKAAARKVTKAEVGRAAVCPVTGEKFKVTPETGSASYKGKIYYFCCPSCDKPFLENPEKYVGKKKPAAAHAKIYMCPMGDYQGDKPGKCPKCGMDLVEKK